MEGDRGREPGRKGTEDVQEAGVERAESGRGRLCNMAQYFAIEKTRKDAGANRNMAGTGSKEYGKRKVLIPLSPSHCKICEHWPSNILCVAIVLSGVSKIVIVLTGVKLLITFIIQQESSAVTNLIKIKNNYSIK